MSKAIQDYLQRVTKIYSAGNATEHTYRPALQSLLESLSQGIRVLNEPKRIACGAPDFWIGQGMMAIGYLEAKDIGISLKKVEKTKQIQRYFNALGNLIITNHLEFRWYQSGQLCLEVTLATLDKQKKIKPNANGNGIAELEQLLRQFILAKSVQVNTPRELAKKMASLAQLIRDAINLALKDSDSGGMLRQQLDSFRNVLIRDLTGEQFADMYAQTICYGLFAARCNTDPSENFSRETAAFRLPKTNPFLRGIFNQIAGIELDDRITWAVDTLANILQQTDMTEILKDFGKRTRREDPVVHFYETFLAEYDPKMRESRGVYYTPEPVVNYIVKSVDYILKHKFNIGKGLADAKKIKVLDSKGEKSIETHQVLILDPAVGTGTFMHSVINYIYEGFKSQKGLWSSYVSQHLLPRLFGFELLMAPYTVAHMKLGLQLQELGYDFSSDERLRIYLTNTLQEAFQIPPADGFMNRIRDEAEAAKDIKQDIPIMVILGNPPYSYESVNTDPWIVGLVRDYYEVDGKPLGERNPKGLLDDYVKFIRFAQHRVSETGYGIVALITNHGYLDNPTFRGMRQSLMKTFDEIYVLDLHGNSKKKEVCPDGSPDKNVFDIQQGVAIGIFIKYQNSQEALATVYHADLWGSREVYENKELVGGKYHWLAENDINSTDWLGINPENEYYLFKPFNAIDFPDYAERTWKIDKIFPSNSNGIETGKDEYLISLTREEIQRVMTDLVNSNLSDKDIYEKYGIQDTTGWHFVKRRKLLIQEGLKEELVRRIYRKPFDFGFTYYHEFLRRQQLEVLGNLLEPNIALLSMRQVALESSLYNHFCVTNIIADNRSFLSNKGKANIFPLYLYPTNKPTLFEHSPTNAPGGRHPNLSPEFITDFSRKLDLEFISDGKGDQNKTFGPEDIFNYIYAVFYSPTYRQRYAEFLKIDFPRLPLTSNTSLFWELANIGEELVQFHLMKATGQDISTYPVDGSNIVEQVKYNENEQQIWINPDQYFGNIPPHIWNFYIGGYQVCQKWLKDRKGRELSYEDLTHYQNIISILAETIAIMTKIDQTIDYYGGFPLK